MGRPARPQQGNGLREAARKCMHLFTARAERLATHSELLALAQLIHRLLKALKTQEVGGTVVPPDGLEDGVGELAIAKDTSPTPSSRSSEHADSTPPALAPPRSLQRSKFVFMMKGKTKASQFDGNQGADVYVQGCPISDVKEFRELLDSIFAKQNYLGGASVAVVGDAEGRSEVVVRCRTSERAFRLCEELDGATILEKVNADRSEASPLYLKETARHHPLTAQRVASDRNKTIVQGGTGSRCGVDYADTDGLISWALQSRRNRPAIRETTLEEADVKKNVRARQRAMGSGQAAERASSVRGGNPRHSRVDRTGSGGGSPGGAGGRR